MSIPERLTAALADRYTIERELGAGGMATVYLAQDLKHDRQVAIKVLRPELAAVVGAERFLVEIRTTAKLQHPHILPLHDSGEADSFLFYVMPYVGGESLREKLDREKQLRVDEAVDLARKIGDALDYAHEQGVVHRDIKPANVLLSERGEPLVADFGIALAVSQAGEGRITETGLSLGTPHYMSPEQATGDRDVDPRSDVYALGCVFYEMLAGQPPFAAPTAQAVLARVLTETPRRVTELRRTVPPHVASVIARALEKLPADRFSSVREMLDALGREDFTYLAHAAPPAGTATHVAGSPAASRSRRGIGSAAALLVAGAVVATAVLASVGVLGGTTEAGAAPGEGLVRAAATLPDDFEWSAGSVMRISPTGDQVAVQGSVGETSGIWLRDLSNPEFRLVPDTEGIRAFALSPDGTELVVALADGEGVVRMDFDGGNRRQVTPESAVALDWGDDDHLYFLRGEILGDAELTRVPVSGAAPVEALSVGGLLPHIPADIEVLPGGAGVLVGRFDVTGGPPHLAIWRPGSNELEILLEDALAARYIPTGHLVFTDLRGDLRAAPFDLGRLDVTGSSIQLERRVARPNPGTVRFDVALDGTLVYSEGRTTGIGDIFGGGALVEVSLDGTVNELRPGVAIRPRWSRSGEQVLYAGGSGLTDIELRLYDPALAVRPRTLAGDVDVAVGGIWSPDGSAVVFLGGRDFVSATPRVASVSESTSRPIPGPDQEQATGVVQPVDWTQAGILWLLFDEGLYLQPDTSAPAAIWLEGSIQAARISPTEDYVAYTERGSGGLVIQARSFPEIGPPVRISEGLGGAPVWSVDGTSVYFFRDVDGVRQLRRARLTRDPVLAVLDEATVADSLSPLLSGLDTHPDGTRFVAGLQSQDGGDSESDASRPQITPERTWIVVNWFERIREAFADEGR